MSTDILAQEEIKNILDHDGYAVSNYGDIYSLNYRGSGKVKKLKPFLVGRKNSQYLAVDLGKRKNIKVHRIVCKEFHENVKNLKEVNHIDGDKLNNRSINLEWVTRHQNMQHAWKTGLKVPIKGSNHANSKLTDKDVIEIKVAISTAYYFGKYSFLAKKYNVSKYCIADIKSGKSWSHL